MRAAIVDVVRVVFGTRVSEGNIHGALGMAFGIIASNTPAINFKYMKLK